jgi:hypothetical protein
LVLDDYFTGEATLMGEEDEVEAEERIGCAKRWRTIAFSLISTAGL